MPVVDVTIGKRDFQLVCGDGQEGHLRQLAESVNHKLSLLSESMKNSNDTLLLVMTALMIQDELNESGSNAAKVNGNGEDTDAAVADALNAIADYVEGLAERFKNG